jgi:hypothetical protein
MARRRTASGFRAGMPRPWWVSALRSDGQVVPQLLGGGVDAAQLLGQGEGAFGRGPVGRSGWAASPSAAGDAKACDRGHARDPRRSRRHVGAALAESALVPSWVRWSSLWAVAGPRLVGDALKEHADIQRVAAGRTVGPTACLVRSREACKTRRVAVPSLGLARAVSTGRIRKLGCSTQVGT